MALAGSIWLLVMSLPITGFLLMRPLEIEAGGYGNPSELAKEGVRYIVVLSGDTVTGDSSPTDRWGHSILRVMEGIRLRQGIPNSILVLSGASSPGSQSQADAMATLPSQLGVPKQSLMLETRAWDTIDEAKLFAHVVGKEPFALVTSATHLPRSMEIFRNLGLKPLGCPCDFRTKKWPATERWFLPGAEGLLDSEYAIHEYLGRLWFMIRTVVRPLQPHLKTSLPENSPTNKDGATAKSVQDGTLQSPLILFSPYWSFSIRNGESKM